MSNQYVGEIRIVPFNFAPTGWAFCDGQIMAISQNTALFSLLGTTYGGNGQTTFALPNLQGSAPVGIGAGTGLPLVSLGESGGAATVGLTADQIPAHTHSVNASTSTPSQPSPTNGLWTKGTATSFSTGTPNSVMNSAAIAQSGSGSAHNNLQPYLVLTFIIALQGVFPPRS